VQALWYLATAGPKHSTEANEVCQCTASGTQCAVQEIHTRYQWLGLVSSAVQQ